MELFIGIALVVVGIGLVYEGLSKLGYVPKLPDREF